jgi:hypothetical protein
MRNSNKPSRVASPTPNVSAALLSDDHYGARREFDIVVAQLTEVSCAALTQGVRDGRTDSG